MTLNQLRAFLESAGLGSFTAAAAALQVSQASVSELIRRLEDERGVALFLRGRRQQNFLIEVGVGAAQGYLHHRPAAAVPADRARRRAVAAAPTHQTTIRSAVDFPSWRFLP